MLLLIICSLIYLSLATPVQNIYSLEKGPELFEDFIKEHDKQYKGKEKEERLKIFLNNLKEINSLNEGSSDPVFGITKFADLSKEEFIKQNTGFIPEKKVFLNRKDVQAQKIQRFNYTAPAELDWRNRGVVSRVKNQGNCGSCWAFSTTGNVESINAIKTGNMVEVSEQQLVDCNNENKGCQGGFPVYALSYFLQNGAISEQLYPYEGADGTCRYDSNRVAIKLQNYEHSQIQEQEIVEKLSNTGPLSIILDADPLQFYKNGILVRGCEGTTLDHAVLLVGYGTENGEDYWIIKNSWDVTWGEQGYFRIKRGINCLGISSYGVVTAII